MATHTRRERERERDVKLYGRASAHAPSRDRKSSAERRLRQKY